MQPNMLGGVLIKPSEPQENCRLAACVGSALLAGKSGSRLALQSLVHSLPH